MADPDYLAVNRESWTRSNAQYTNAQARDAWAQDEITWGVFSVPEREIGVLPDVEGKDVVELGCGTAYFGAWLKKRGARRVVGVDITPAQLETARRLNDEFGFGLEFLEENAEHTSLPDAAFDLVLSEFGASIWCDPKLWIAEAARLLRPGGELVFARGSTLLILCSRDDEGQAGPQLVRPQRDLYRLDWTDDDPAVEFHAPTGELLRILRENGFELLRLVELFAPDDAVDHEYYSHVSAEWAKQWPSEEIWRARKGG
jgi:SAM-dependent methyltransferase